MSQQTNRRRDVMFRAFAMESVGHVKFPCRVIPKYSQLPHNLAQRERENAEKNPS